MVRFARAAPALAVPCSPARRRPRRHLQLRLKLPDVFGVFDHSTGCCIDAHQMSADGFEAFVRRYQDAVYATAVRLLGDRAEAEDVAQIVFLKAFQRFDTIGESAAASGWLRTVTTNVCLNHLSRYRRRWRFFSELGAVSGADVHVPFDAPAPGASHALEFERLDDNARLEAALLRLPDHQRVPLVLYHFEGKSYQEIAEALRVSLGKVKTDIHRGREALRHLIDGHDTR